MTANPPSNTPTRTQALRRRAVEEPRGELCISERRLDHEGHDTIDKAPVVSPGTEVRTESAAETSCGPRDASLDSILAGWRSTRTLTTKGGFPVSDGTFPRLVSVDFHGS